MIVLIVIYTVLVLIQFGIDQQDFYQQAQTALFVTELILLGIFVIEIVLHSFAYGTLYIKDPWTIIDIVIIIICSALVLLDLLLDEGQNVKTFFKLRGLFRLLRIFILFRKLNVVRVKSAVMQKRHITQNLDLRAPVEIVVDMLIEFKELIDPSERRLVGNLNYCIQMISSHKLYEADLEQAEKQNQQTERERLLSHKKEERRSSFVNKDVVSWYNNFSSGIQQKRISGASPGLIKDSIFTDKAAEQPLDNLINLTNEAKQQLNLIETQDFNIFEIKDLTRGHELITVSSFIFQKHKFFLKLNIQVESFISFVAKVQSGYKDVAYHNKTHGTDVCQTVYYYTYKCGFLEKAKLDDLEVASMLLAACCHDHEHPGFNNIFLMETRHELALRYNDMSVLENHHVASCFALISNDKYNLTKRFSKDNFKRFRKIMIGCILETDMSKHFAEQSKFKSRVTSWDFDPSGNDKEISMNVLFHLADISNPAKKFDIFKNWTDLLFFEFFIQGDQERDLGLPISYLMDRTTVNIAKSQIGFIDVIVNPAYEILYKVLPKLEQNMQNIQDNKTRWSTMFEEYELQMESEKLKLNSRDTSQVSQSVESIQHK